MKHLIVVLTFILLFNTASLAYLEPSFRIKALGEDFVGIILDEYTDIYRNPAYLGQVQNYKILGEYRKDGNERLVAGSVLPIFNYAKVAILGKGWNKDTRSVYERREVYYGGNYVYISESKSEGSGKAPLTNPGLIYSIGLGPNLNLGANFTYFEDKSKSTGQGRSSNSTTDTTTGILRQMSISNYESHGVTSKKNIQFTAGAKFLMPTGLDMDLTLSFQHLNSENSYASNNYNQYETYDSVGNLTQSIRNSSVIEAATPDQEGNRYGIGLRVSKPFLSLDQLNLLLGFSFTDWDVSTRVIQNLFRNDTLMYSVNQIFNGDRENIDMVLKFGIESREIEKVKLYAGITNFLTWEKQAYPDSVPNPPASKFRTSFYKISLPIGIEYRPFKKIALRYGALPNYVYTRTESVNPNTNSSLSIYSNKTMTLSYSIGAGLQVIKNLTLEGYVTKSGNLLTADNWMIGASYTF